MCKVINVWIDSDNKQVGARIEVEDGVFEDLSLEDIQISYKNRLSNAVVMPKGLRGKVGSLPREILRRKTDNRKAVYTLMYKDIKLCEVYTDKVSIYNYELLPFNLKGVKIDVISFNDWLNKRLSSLSRTYMNRVYIVRMVGRDREQILRDSCGLSITDNYWIQRSDVKTSWNELRTLLDINRNLIDTALYGDISKINFKDKLKDTTSIYTIKGVFPKIVYRGLFLKKGANAEYEILASQLGKCIGVSTVKAFIYDSEIVGIELFTSEEISLAHTSELLQLTDYVENKDDSYRAMYDYFKELKRDDIVKDLERLYLFNYIVGNADMHIENYGFLYKSDTFEITKVAPSFDFNNAFVAFERVDAFYEWILDNMYKFVNNNRDIVDKLNSDDFNNLVLTTEYIEEEQKESMLERVNWLLSLINKM